MKTKNYLKMKKITLLLVAAVFAIGIQSCSTDDKPEQIGDVIPENALNSNELFGKQNSLSKALGSGNIDATCFTKIYVVFPKNSTAQDRMDYLEFSQGKKGTYSIIFASTVAYCAGIYEWYVPCNELPTSYCDFIKCKLESLNAKTNGAVVHEAEQNKILLEETEGDPACSECPETSYTWISTESCDEIWKSINYQ